MATLLLAKAATISSGTDAIALSARIEQTSSGDVSTIDVGRNLLAGATGGIEVAGPGRLEITAGYNIDFGTSRGVVTSGNLRNAGLPPNGASVGIGAAAAGTPSLDVLASRYLTPIENGGSARSDQYRDALLGFVRGALHDPDLSFATAWSLFKRFPATAQATFCQQVLAAEFAAVYLTSPVPTATGLTAALEAAFDARKADLLAAIDDALNAGNLLSLSGRTSPQRDTLAAYLAQRAGVDVTKLDSTVGALLQSGVGDSLRQSTQTYRSEIAGLAGLDINSVVAARVAALAQAQSGWADAVAASSGGTAASFNLLAQANPQDPAVLAYRKALTTYSGATFDRYRQTVLQSELSTAGAAASGFGFLSLPMRMTLYDQGFRVAELAGVGSFDPQAAWQGAAPLLTFAGAMNLTQSSVVTERGGGISLLNPGGAINVGLKDNQPSGSASAAKGVTARGGGDIAVYAEGDVQVNTQRVFIVGSGDMTVWSSVGDIDSGRGANTAVAAPPLQARRSVDGVVFEVPATTTGGGLGILPDASGNRGGTIGLYPAIGEILALDAYIRAPALVLGSTVKGADNLITDSVSGATAAVAAPALNVVQPPASVQSQVGQGSAAASTQQEQRQRSSLLTVELLGIGPAIEDEGCSDEDERRGKCRRALQRCKDGERRVGGECR